MLDNITEILELINEYLLSPISVMTLIFAGIFLSVRLKFFHLTNPIKLIRHVTQKCKKDDTSPFRALTVALAGTLGVGNISGVALAIAYGGPGAVFWMWVSAILSMIVKYAEIVLAVYHRDEANCEIHGGAMYYLKNGIKRKGVASVLSIGFAVFCLFSSLSTGSVVQVSAVSEAFSGCFNIQPLISGIIMTLLCSAAIFGHNAKKISNITVKLVPIMSLTFIILSLIIIITNISKMPSILNIILDDAFTAQAGVGGILSFLFARSVRFGVTKGLFSNEAGCGTSTIAHASSNTSSAATQGIWGIFEVFFDTIILCSLSAFVLLISYGEAVPKEGGGVMVSLCAYTMSLGSFAGDLLAFSMFLFAYATIICWAFYGCECLYFLTKNISIKNLYLIFYSLSVLYGAIAPSSFIWAIADSSICIMMCVNTICVCLMSDTVVELSKNGLLSSSIKKLSYVKEKMR